MQYPTYSRVLFRLSTTTSTATGTSATSSHPARIHLKCSRTGAEIRSRVPATRASSISSEFPFSKTTAYSRSYCTMAQHCIREGHSCRPLSPRGRALMPVEARSRLDGQGFRGGMKGRRIKGTRYGERRARGTWVGNPGLL